MAGEVFDLARALCRLMRLRLHFSFVMMTGAACEIIESKGERHTYGFLAEEGTDPKYSTLFEAHDSGWLTSVPSRRVVFKLAGLIQKSTSRCRGAFFCLFCGWVGKKSKQPFAPFSVDKTLLLFVCTCVVQRPW